MIEHLTVQVPDSAHGESNPQLTAWWTRQPSDMGWTAVASFRRATDAPTCSHEIYVGTTAPACTLEVRLDARGEGCLARTSLPFADLTPRDLVWAAWWAFEAIQLAHALYPERCASDDPESGGQS